MYSTSMCNVILDLHRVLVVLTNSVIGELRLLIVFRKIFVEYKSGFENFRGICISNGKGGDIPYTIGLECRWVHNKAETRAGNKQSRTHFEFPLFDISPHFPDTLSRLSYF